MISTRASGRFFASAKYSMIVSGVALTVFDGRAPENRVFRILPGDFLGIAAVVGSAPCCVVAATSAWALVASERSEPGAAQAARNSDSKTIIEIRIIFSFVYLQYVIKVKNREHYVIR
jgi:hypothetical protein